MKENEVDDLNRQESDPAADVDKETTAIDRRRFFGGLAAVIGATAAIGGTAAAGEKGVAEAKEIKSKILSRIQEQLKQEEGEDGMIYDKGTVLHSRYLRGDSPTPVPGVQVER